MHKIKTLLNLKNKDYMKELIDDYENGDLNLDELK